MRLRIGVCEDHLSVRRVLLRGLATTGHTVVAAHDGREALALLGADRGLHVLVMDIFGLPDADGRDVVHALKAAGQHAPVLFLTGLDGPGDVLAGFAAGADDYVVKPFLVEEVLARVEALARRGVAGRGTVTGLVLDPLTHTARTDGGDVLLTPTEYRMLAAITSRPGEAVRRRVVVAAGWPDGDHVSENTVDSFMRRIRGKLEAVGSPTGIETVRGVGYRTR